MVSIARSWQSRLAYVLPLLAPFLLPSPSAEAEPREPWPSRVHALYKVEFNGFDIGTFAFTATVNGQTYALQGDARLSALLGAFKWRGQSQSAGTVVAEAPRPAGYTFDFEGPLKSGSLRMAYAGDTVRSLVHVPPPEPQPGVIPVKEAHLKGVLDPLSAVMAVARSPTDANPCGRRLAIFDGKQRFDLTLTYKRQEAVAETRPSGQPGVAFVCRVRYQPIAGHKHSEETRTLAHSSDIEVSLRPVPSARLFIPHQITVPTAAGTATLTSQRVEIVTTNEQIALSY